MFKVLLYYTISYFYLVLSIIKLAFRMTFWQTWYYLGLFIYCVHNIFRKSNIYPLICTPTCAYQGVRKVSFSKHFAYILNGWFFLLLLLPNTESYAEPCQASKMECFVKMLNGFWPLTLFGKHFILDVWQGSEYDSATDMKIFKENNQNI